MGRPKLPEKKCKRSFVMIRVTKDEKSMHLARAKKMGLSLTEYFKEGKASEIA